ncbi:hypothetical protein Tco_1309387 [Tanacetum coccineum]
MPFILASLLSLQGFDIKEIIYKLCLVMNMAASAIIISSDSSDESRNSTIAPPVISSAAPMVETTLVASPTGLCGLVPYTGSDSDSQDEMSSPEHISPLPAISPFICTDSSEALDSSDGPPLQDPYVTTIARWRTTIAGPLCYF